MKKIKITFEAKSANKREKRISTLEKLVRAFMRLVSNLPNRDKAELARLIVIAFALVTQTYLLIWILTFFLNRP